MDNKQLQDEQELAKVLAGVSDQINMVDPPADKKKADSKKDDKNKDAPAADVSVPDFSGQLDQIAQPAAAAEPKPLAELDQLKLSAINDLRPLVDKLNLPLEEKFDTYLLLIRSTDDSSLLQPAYEVARQIEDETKRAESLLNVIKEIDYFNSGNKK